ncbi:MAG: tRNA dihydrouridine synthase [Bdellovibrionia bacterium]
MNAVGIQANRPALVLAPMEGVTDAPMRALLTQRGGFTLCVSEFIRISQSLLPARTYLEHVPELKTGCRTQAQVPVQIQLLGGDEQRLAKSAVQAVQLGAPAIDLNFGCPAPTVNRHDGGASLLRSPERIERIVSAVRQAVPGEIPVSAKLRLGWEFPNEIYRTSEAAVKGGASWLTIHARTKMQGYAPPVFWDFIGEVRRNVGVPVVANGDIWSFEDFLRCQQKTGCIHFMLGRGALADPSLPLQIATRLGIKAFQEEDQQVFGAQPEHWLKLIEQFAELSLPVSQGRQFTARRVKQWFGFVGARRAFPWITDLKRAQDLDQIFHLLQSQSF